MASKIVNIGNQNQKSSIVDCNDVGVQAPILSDVGGACGTANDRSPGAWLEDASNKKIGLGKQANCDPMQTGQIINDTDPSKNRNVVYRPTQALRGVDEGTTDLFRNIIVIDEEGKVHPVPIIWASQEKAVAAIIQDNVRKDNSLVVDRIKLPMLAISSNSIQFNQNRYIYHKAVDYMTRLRPDGKPGFTANERYERDTVFGVARGIPVDIGFTLYAWTLYIEDMNQIVEQIITKFSPIAYIVVRGVPWEIGVKLDSISNNLDVEPGDQNIRVIKYEFSLTVEAYIPQPIVRKKAVLRERLNFFNSAELEQVDEVIDRVEEAVEGFE